MCSDKLMLYPSLQRLRRIPGANFLVGIGRPNTRIFANTHTRTLRRVQNPRSMTPPPCCASSTFQSIHPLDSAARHSLHAMRAQRSAKTDTPSAQHRPPPVHWCTFRRTFRMACGRWAPGHRVARQDSRATHMPRTTRVLCLSLAQRARERVSGSVCLVGGRARFAAVIDGCAALSAMTMALSLSGRFVSLCLCTKRFACERAGEEESIRGAVLCVMPGAVREQSLISTLRHITRAGLFTVALARKSRACLYIVCVGVMSDPKH